jgi:cystathionine beta-lyase
MDYDFDEIIDRTGTNALNTDGWRDYMFHDPDLRLPFPESEFVRMWVADMEFATPPAIVQALRDRLDRRIFGYSKLFDPGYFEAFAGWCRRQYDWTVRKEDHFTSPGVIPALYELVAHICTPGDRVLVVTPCYGFLKYAAVYNGLEVVTSDLLADGGRYRMDFEDLEAKARDPRTTLCIFCNPHNPTGRVWTPDELRRFGRICLDNGLWIVSDEIHCDLLRCGQVHTPVAKVFPGSDRIVTCMSPSKTFNLAGFMFANVLIPEPGLRKAWLGRHYPLENPLSITAAKAAYSLCDDWHGQLKRYLDGNFAYTRDFLAARLPETVFQVGEATFLAWVNVRAYLPDVADLALHFATRAGVLLEDGNMFVANADGYIRLNLACPRATLEVGLERIARLLLG